MIERYHAQGELQLAATPATAQALATVKPATIEQVREQMDASEARGEEPERWDGLA